MSLPTDPFRVDLSEAEDALARFAQGPAQAAADSVAQAFEQASVKIAEALGRAALKGEVDFKKLAKVALEELAKVVLDRALPQIFPERGGGSTPAFNSFAGGSPGALTVNLNIAPGADAAGFQRSQGQIAAALAKAVAFGSGRL